MPVTLCFTVLAFLLFLKLNKQKTTLQFHLQKKSLQKTSQHIFLIFKSFFISSFSSSFILVAYYIHWGMQPGKLRNHIQLWTPKLTLSRTWYSYLRLCMVLFLYHSIWILKKFANFALLWLILKFFSDMSARIQLHPVPSEWRYLRGKATPQAAGLSFCHCWHLEKGNVFPREAQKWSGSTRNSQHTS